MKRVLVLGCGGAGKSTLSQQIAARTGLPHVYLDGLYWKENWQPTDAHEWEEIVSSIIARESWVLDGNYGGTLPIRLDACDTVVFLDTPRRVCLYRLIRRRIRYHGKRRPGLPAGCKERLPLDFVTWVWSYPKRRRPVILETLAALSPDKTVTVLKNERERTAFLSTL